MINDLTIRNASLRIFVDDTTTFEVVKKGQQSKAQITANEVVVWSTKNRFQLNSEKCKELRISFTSASEFLPVVIGQKCIKLVKDAKLLGITVSSDLTRNAHVSEVTTKGCEEALFSPATHKSTSLAERSVPFLYHMRALSHRLCCSSFSSCAACVPLARIRAPTEESNANHLSWYRISASVSAYELPTVAEHHHNICKRTFKRIMNDPNHKLRKLLPPLHSSKYDLRHARKFTLPRCKTNRFKNSFIMASSRIVNNS